jgi:hypothetical protein
MRLDSRIAVKVCMSGSITFHALSQIEINPAISLKFQAQKRMREFAVWLVNGGP